MSSRRLPPLRQFLAPAIAFALAALLSLVAARTAAVAVETTSVDAVEQIFTREDVGWADVVGDGLQVVVEGVAPSEAARFRAISLAGEAVEASRVIDNTQVEAADLPAAPDFTVEILRNDSGISLIGLIPAETDRQALDLRVSQVAGDAPITDLLETADHPRPEGWRRSMSFALDALERLPRAKVSVEAGRVAITAMAESNDDRRRLEAELGRMAPDGVRLELRISAPRPVVTPYTVRFVSDDSGARFEACTADSEAARDRIVEAATQAGLEGRISCTLGLGVPTRTWGEAVAMAIRAVDELGGGTVTFADADVTLTAAAGTERAVFDRVIGELANALPGAYALEAVLPEPPDAADEAPTEFTATLSPEGEVQLRGRIPDEVMNDTLRSYARARFGADSVTMGTRLAEDLPQGWAVRVLAGVEALSKLENGAVIVTPEAIEVRGNTGDPEASDAIARLFIEKIGQVAEFSVDVAYREDLDPAAGLPTDEECVAQIGVVTDGRKITFDPGSATLTGDTERVVDDIAEILKQCPDAAIEVAGYTDSQGRDSMNLELSQDRAEAVLTAIRERRVPVAAFTATGYGEADPIADNDTPEGREANRRIEFRLIEPEPAEDDATALEGPEAGAEAGDGEVPPAAQEGIEGGE